jgi:hypothetical protein
MQALDKYINDVIAKKHGTQADELPIIIRNRFALSIQANIDYHKSMAEGNMKAGDIAMANFHSLKVRIYESLLPK